MSEHTPGPWVLKPARSIVGGWAVWAEYEPGKHCQVADIEPWPNDPDTAPESEANARLIAAAPDLLAACEAAETILSLVSTWCADETPSGQRCNECLGCLNNAASRAVMAAIAKARGEVPS